jgi:hypothetical protein
VSPIIELQRRMVEAGRIRAGEKGDKGEPRKLSNWRLTSKDKVRLDEAAKLWGGEVRDWKERQGEFELYTETAALPIMLLPGQLPTTWYELWSKGGCQRRCDGQHELISDSSCLCGEERECKPHTRLSVLLPDLPGIGSWLLSSTGWNAAAELAGAADLLQRASAQGVLIPARLRLEARVQITGGQTRRFAVPVIDIDVSFRELLGAQSGLERAALPALPQGYTPLTGNGGNGVSLEDGLTAAETQTATRTSRSAAPIPEHDDILFDEAPVPVDDEAPTEKPLTLLQCKTKMNALVGQLREGGKMTTEQLYVALAKERNLKVETMIGVLKDARDDEGVLHWAPLRDSLTLEEARALHARLARFWVNVQTVAV